MRPCTKHPVSRDCDPQKLTLLLFPNIRGHSSLSFSSLLSIFSPTVLQYAVCRDVTLPDGPLYRVAGFPLILPCAVSGYEGPRVQDFEWFLYRHDAGGRQIGVVSTRDEGFPYVPFMARVKNGEVRVERDTGDKVRLVIQRLRTEDQGKWECYTPSTDNNYRGSYSATVNVTGTLHIMSCMD